VSVLVCENCSVRVDTDEELDGRYDVDQDVYTCPLCTEEGDAQYGFAKKATRSTALRRR
jgi:hypothetical protein